MDNVIKTKDIKVTFTKKLVPRKPIHSDKDFIKINNKKI